MIHNHWLSITHHDSQPLAGVLCCASDCESWCVILSQLLWIMLCILSRPVVVNHSLLCWASGCESWCVKLNQWSRKTMCHSEPVVVTHGVIFWASGSASWCIILSQWLWIILCYSEPTNGSAWPTITQAQSTQYNTTWFTTVRSE
jgi:hypothetical protein